MSEMSIFRQLCLAQGTRLGFIATGSTFVLEKGKRHKWLVGAVVA
jgi:hypothetical protein